MVQKETRREVPVRLLPTTKDDSFSLADISAGSVVKILLPQSVVERGSRFYTVRIRYICILAFTESGFVCSHPATDPHNVSFDQNRLYVYHSCNGHLRHRIKNTYFPFLPQKIVGHNTQMVQAYRNSIYAT